MYVYTEGKIRSEVVVKSRKKGRCITTMKKILELINVCIIFMGTLLIFAPLEHVVTYCRIDDCSSTVPTVHTEASEM